MTAVAAGPRRPAAWFALLLPGVLAAGSVPVSAVVSPQPSSSGIFFLVKSATVTKALYLGTAPFGYLTGFPLGWYWTAALTACLVLTTLWYRRQGALQPAWLRGYLVAGTALVVVTVALPLAGWTTPVSIDSPVADWLDVLWQQGTFAQLAIAVMLGILARGLRSRALIVIGASYAVLVCLAGWIEFQNAPISSPVDPYVVPAAVLLLAGLGSLIAAVIRPRTRAVTSGTSAT
jgi:hypothetical protein